MQAMPRLRAAAGVRWWAGWPSISIDPPSGWCAPVMTLMSVDLPAPFSPRRAWTSPALRSNDTPFKARTAPNDLGTANNRRSVLEPLIAFAEHILLIPLELAQPAVAD